MPSVGGDAPYGSAGPLHAGPRDSDAATPPGGDRPEFGEPGEPTAGSGRHVADGGVHAATGATGPTGATGATGPSGAAGATDVHAATGATGVDADEPYAFRRGRHGDTTGSKLAAREAGAGVARLLRGEWRPALCLVAAGLLVAAAWRAAAPSVADAGNPLEKDIAVDGTLAAIGVLAGILTSTCVLLRPGRYPARRTLVVIGFSVVASVVSWQVGDLLGTPHLRAYGIVLIWPIISSAGLFAGSLLPGLSRRLED